MDLSYSSISTFKHCRKKFKFSNVDNLEPKRTDESTSVGAVIHEAFEKFFVGDSIQECTTYISERFNDKLGACQNPWEEEDLLVDKHIALGMWINYPFTNVTFTKVIPEQKFRIRVPGYKDVFFVGYLDGLVMDTNTKTMIREVKTTGLSIQQMKDRSEISMQGTSYVWAVQNILGERIHGLYYDVIRKPLLKKNKSETAQGFAERNFNYYADKDSHDKLYGAFPVWKTELALKQFEEDLKKDVREIVRANKKGYYQRNTDCCYLFNRECPFKKLCFQEGTPDPDMVDAFYMPRKRREREEARPLLEKGCKNPLEI